MDSGNVRKKDTVAELVVAFCKDFARREEAIAQGNLSHRTIVELKYYNYKILEAAREIVGERDAPVFISDIGNSVGYASSSLDYFSEAYYKTKKIEVRNNIAKRLHLTD